MWSPTNLVKLVSTGKRRRQMFICRGSNSGIFFFKTKRVDFERFVWLEMDVLNREVEGNKLNSQRERNVSKAASKLFQCFFEEAQNTWNREIGGMDHSRNGVCVKCKNKFLTTNNRKKAGKSWRKKIVSLFFRNCRFKFRLWASSTQSDQMLNKKVDQIIPKFAQKVTTVL